MKNSKKSMLIQVGGLGESVIDHLVRPISLTGMVDKTIIFSHDPGLDIPNVEYRHPPGLLSKVALLSFVYEAINLFFTALTTRSAILAGFMLNPHGILSYIIAKLTGKKSLVFLISGRNEFFTRDRKNGRIGNRNLNGDLPPKYGRFLLNILRHVDTIITTGSVTRRFLIRHGIDGDKIFPVISPVNVSRFYQIDMPKLYDVISIGNLYTIKHHDVVLKSIAEVKKKYPHIKACIVGNGPNRQQLLETASDLGINENMYFAGFQKDVPYFYNSSKIFMHTSETEGFPNVFLEAMSCGLPCVVSNCGDIVDIAKDGFNSLVIDRFDNYNAFAQAILALLENKELYCRLSLNARNTMKTISIENAVCQWKSILDGRLGKPEK